MALSSAEVQQLILERGGTPEQAVLFDAIAAAESGRNPNPQPDGDIGLENAEWGPSVGLFQVRTLKAETGTGQPRDIDILRDAGRNADSAKIISEGWTNPHPWSTYTNGEYKRFLSPSAAPTTTSQTPVAVPPPVSPTPVHPCAGLKGAPPAGFRTLFFRHPLMEGNDVRELQQRLAAEGFVPANSHTDEGWDGIYGPGTASAVVALEKAKGLSVDSGIAGVQVWCALGIG